MNHPAVKMAAGTRIRPASRRETAGLSELHLSLLLGGANLLFDPTWTSSIVSSQKTYLFSAHVIAGTMQNGRIGCRLWRAARGTCVCSCICTNINMCAMRWPVMLKEGKEVAVIRFLNGVGLAGLSCTLATKRTHASSLGPLHMVFGTVQGLKELEEALWRKRGLRQTLQELRLSDSRRRGGQDRGYTAHGK